MTTDVAAEETIYCANHPTTPTLLRCNKCNKPICPKCTVQTPVGFRCKECVRNQQSVYFTAETKDNPTTFAISMVASAIATPIAGYVMAFAGFYGFILAFMVGSAAGGALGQIIRRAVNRRRGRWMGWVAVAGVVCGVLVGALISTALIGGFIFFSPSLWIFAVLTAVSVYQLLR